MSGTGRGSAQGPQGQGQPQSEYQKLVDLEDANKLLDYVPTDGMTAQQILAHKQKMHTIMDEPIEKTIVWLFSYLER